jgi:hypothetical protein
VEQAEEEVEEVAGEAAGTATDPAAEVDVTAKEDGEGELDEVPSRGLLLPPAFEPLPVTEQAGKLPPPAPEDALKENMKLLEEDLLLSVLKPDGKNLLSTGLAEPATKSIALC